MMKKILSWSLLCFAIFCLAFVIYKTYQKISYDRQLKGFSDNIETAVNRLDDSDASYGVAESRAKESLDAMALHTSNSLQEKGIKDMRDALEDLRLCHQNRHLIYGFSEGDFEAWKVRSSFAFDELQPTD
jgi:hypothetical protein